MFANWVAFGLAHHSQFVLIIMKCPLPVTLPASALIPSYILLVFPNFLEDTGIKYTIKVWKYNSVTILIYE